MSTIWIVSIIALWFLVLFETGLLLLLLRALGKLRQQGTLFPDNYQPPESWGIPLGEQAPSFMLKDQEDHIVRLEDFRGKRCVLAFISPGCSYCTRVIEALNMIQQNNPDLALLLLGGSDGESNRVYAAAHNAQMPILTITSGFDKDVYRIQGVPFTFVLDEGGFVRSKGLVAQPELFEELLKQAFPSVAVTH